MQQPSNNYVISEALKDKIITPDEFDIIFADKADWFTVNDIGIKNWEKSSKKIEFFWDALEKLLPYYLNTAKYYDYNDVVFPPVDFLPSLKSSFPKEFTKLVRFSHAKFYGVSHFSQIIFQDEAMFDNVDFYDNAIFLGTIFKKNITFHSTRFHKDATLVNSQFENKAMFVGTTFKQVADFRGSDANKILFTNAIINKIDLFGFTYKESNFLYMKNYANEKLNFTVKNFINKETARIIKASLEKQNNITESNKYFTIEQELYLKDLKEKNSKEPNKELVKFTLRLNKYVSNFGTDWIRPLLVMFIFGFFASFFYNLPICLPKDLKDLKIFIEYKDILYWTSGGFIYGILIYLFYYYKEWNLLKLFTIGYIGMLIFIPELRVLTNDISKLINPLNIFKNKDYFEHIAPYGMIVKLIMATLIYQFIMAFRQNTRRK